MNLIMEDIGMWNDSTTEPILIKGKEEALADPEEVPVRPIMRYLTPFAFVAVITAKAFAAPQGIPILSDYDKLLGLCEAGGPDSYVGVKYQDGFLTTFAYGQCYPYELPVHGLAQMAVFCKSVTCENNPNPDCTGGAIPPVPVPVLAGLTLINAADFVQIIGQGATCQPNAL